MKDRNKPEQRWLLGMQSAFVLPVARGIYLLIALACLLVVVGGVIYGVYLQASILGQPSTEPLPPSYEGSAPVEATSERSVDLAVVQSRLEPPNNIRFVVIAATLASAPGEGQLLGHFVADTPNGLAPFPDGISVLGGTDAALFERVRDGSRGRIGLAARAELAAEIEDVLRDAEADHSRTFAIRVVARDRYGLTSAPADLSFTLRFSPTPAAPAEPPTESQAVSQPEPTELQAIAREIARIVEPEVNPDHFSAYQTAVEVPGRCRAEDDDQTFVANYRRALEEVRPRLTGSNVEAFYTGLCEAWKTVLEQETAARERAEQAQRAELRAAEDARARAQARNNEMLQQHEARVFAAKAQTALVMSVIGGALAIFLVVALVLAFLAIEGHSRAVRAAVESMIRLSEGRPVGESAPGRP